VVLVPEIALTPQTAGRFTRRFGDVAVMHSGLTASQRHRAWARAASGEARVVVGARSAVFAPMPRLGLIVVDEEHDGSYKQDQLPRYQARDVAVKRGQGLGIPVVLGSATPSLESYANAKAGRYVLHRMTTRPGESRLPSVKVVDLAQEGRLRARLEGKDGRLRMIGPTLEGALEKVLKEDGQAILLLNRRGFAHYLSCPSTACGTVIGCESCDARLVLHKGEDLPRGAVVKCHHCLAERIVPELCPACGRKLNPFGGGTQRLEAEVVRSFASMGIAAGETLLRLDADTMRRATDYFEALERFGRGEARVIVGTQMVAKGLDFPGVRLVGVVDADTSLNIPDFRSEERTFQLVSQVAGRAGRGEEPGVVIVQTYSPGASAIVHAARHDYEGFAEEEVKARSVHGLPPMTRMARIVCRDEEAQEAWRRAEGLSAALREIGAGGVSVSVPTACPVGRIAERTRIAVDVIARNAAELQSVLREARHRGLLKSDAATAVDVDPVSLL
jgi:primosomal protein N' (replication factor Y)